MAISFVIESMKAEGGSISSKIESRREENGSTPTVFEPVIEEKEEEQEEKEQEQQEIVRPIEEINRVITEIGRVIQEIARAIEEIENETEEHEMETEENDEETNENDEVPEEIDEVPDESERQSRITGEFPLTHPKNATHRTLATLSLPKQVGALVTYTQNVVTRMTGNANFTTPVPALPAVTTACNELQTAETAALARTKGAVAIRNEKRTTLVALLQHLRGYVQSIADGNVENGTSIIESAGMAVRKATVRKPRVWVTQPVTIQAKTTVLGLTTGATVQFRYKPVTAKGGEGDWSQPVALVIR